jgi:putative FmdB family regulatory protein
MPTYDYSCRTCGGFEIWRDHREAGAPLPCPSCGSETKRLFSAPAVRAPSDPFGSASREVRARVERSRTGEPVTSYGSLPGRAIAHGGHSHGQAHGHGHARTPPRPWQVGH